MSCREYLTPQQYSKITIAKGLDEMLVKFMQEAVKSVDYYMHLLYALHMYASFQTT